MSELTKTEQVWLEVYKAAIAGGNNEMAAVLASRAVIEFNTRFGFTPTATTSGVVSG